MKFVWHLMRKRCIRQFHTFQIILYPNAVKNVMLTQMLYWSDSIKCFTLYSGNLTIWITFMVAGQPIFFVGCIKRLVLRYEYSWPCAWTRRQDIQHKCHIRYMRSVKKWSDICVRSSYFTLLTSLFGFGVLVSSLVTYVCLFPNNLKRHTIERHNLHFPLQLFFHCHIYIGNKTQRRRNLSGAVQLPCQVVARAMQGVPSGC